MVPALGKRVPGKGILYGSRGDFLIHWSPAIRGSGPLIPGASHSFRHGSYIYLSAQLSFVSSPFLLVLSASECIYLLSARLFLCAPSPIFLFLCDKRQSMSAVTLLVLSFSSCQWMRLPLCSSFPLPYHSRPVSQPLSVVPLFDLSFSFCGPANVI